MRVELPNDWSRKGELTKQGNETNFKGDLKETQPEEACQPSTKGSHYSRVLMLELINVDNRSVIKVAYG